MATVIQLIPLILAVLASGPSGAEQDAAWGSDYRLTDNIFQDYLAYPNQHKIAVDPAGRIHAVWYQYDTCVTLFYQVFYKRYNPGTGWTNDTMLSADLRASGCYSRYPSIAIDPAGNVHVVWTSGTNTFADNGVYHKMCTPSGSGNGGWQAASDLVSTNPSSIRKQYPNIAASSDNHLHIVWREYSTAIDQRLIYREKTGSGWTSTDTLVSGYNRCVTPSIAASGDGLIHVAWHGYGTSSSQFYDIIWYRRRVGTAWQLEENVSANPPVRYARWPSIACDPTTDRPHVAWFGQQYAGSMHMRVMHNNRTTSWQAVDTVSEYGSIHDQFEPQLCFSADGVAHCIWYGFSASSPSYYQVRYGEMPPGGSWSSVEELTTGDYSRYYPSITSSAQKLDIVWQDPRHGTYELYTKSGQMQSFDVGVSGIVQPAGTLLRGFAVAPITTVRNCKSQATPGFRVWFLMADSSGARRYDQYVDLAGLSAGTDTSLVFPSFMFDTTLLLGTWTTKCSLFLAGDSNPANDVRTGSFKLVEERPPWPYGWFEVASLLGGAMVKDGGWLAMNQGSGLIYCCKGNKSNEFCAYEPIGDTYTTLAVIPAGPSGKLPKKGCDGITDGENYVYMTKGNNTFEFWRYSISDNVWESLPNVPEGPRRKGCKKGTDLSYVTGRDGDYVYLLKGYTTEFYRFDVSASAWEPALPDVPAGARPKVDEGSWLCWDENATLYLLKAKYGELWPYDLSTGTWGSQLPPMPFVGMMGKKKKPKDGSAGAWYGQGMSPRAERGVFPTAGEIRRLGRAGELAPALAERSVLRRTQNGTTRPSDGSIYALKGGNTCEFWKYTPGDSWHELDTMPQVGSTGKKKRVKTGGDIVSYGSGAFFALKGNKTLELWRYVMPLCAPRSTPDARGGISSSVERSADSAMRISPNPLVSGLAMVYLFVTPSATRGLTGDDLCATVRVYDELGRLVESAIWNPQSEMALDLRSLSAGVYLVRLEADGFTATRKLVIER